MDAVRQMLREIETTGQEGTRDDSILIATLTRLQQTPAAPKAVAAVPAPESAAEVAAPPTSMGDILMQQAGVTAAEVQLAAQKQEAGDPRRLGEILVEQGSVRPADVADALRTQQSSRVGSASASDSTIRVDVSLLDKLMNLVGELVLARNQVLQRCV